METVAGLKQMESTLTVTCDRINVLKAKLEDLIFRAQRIASAMKNHMSSTDTMFGYDLQNFRRDIRSFSAEIQALPGALGSLERGASYDLPASKFASAVMRLTMRLSQSLRGLHDMALLAHQHIRSADHKMDAWYMAQEVEEMATHGQGLPTVANKIMIVTSTPLEIPPANR